MSEVKRYRLDSWERTRFGETEWDCGMTEAVTGEYVLASDYDALIEERNTLWEERDVLWDAMEECDNCDPNATYFAWRRSKGER